MMMDPKDANRYVFGLTGTIREIIYPSKAILAFRFNGKDGRIPHQSDAILPKRKPSAGWGADTQA